MGELSSLLLLLLLLWPLLLLLGPPPIGPICVALYAAGECICTTDISTTCLTL